MPRNFAEAWESRARKTINTAAVATFLDGVAELNTEVIEVGSGSASESNIIHIPIANFKPEVLVNNTTYPIALQEYNDSESVVKLDKYQTKVTTLTDDQVIGASYDRMDAAQKPHLEEINAKKFQKAIHALAPQENTTDTPVITATGEADATGRKRLTYEDLVEAKKVLKGATKRRLVLCDAHYNDLLLDRKNFGDKLVNYNQGDVAPVIAGFEIHTYTACPLFDKTTKTKKPFGAVATENDTEVSVFFDVANVVKKTGLTKQYYSDAKSDPETQTNKLNYRHYFIAVPVEAKLIGAII